MQKTFLGGNKMAPNTRLSLKLRQIPPPSKENYVSPVSHGRETRVSLP